MNINRCDGCGEDGGDNKIRAFPHNSLDNYQWDFCNKCFRSFRNSMKELATGAR